MKTPLLINNLLIDISSFSTIDNKIYFSPLIDQGKKDIITELVNKATKRNSLFWGGWDSKYQIIFCSSDDELKKYSNGISTVTFSTFVGNYTVISMNYANLDIISHELCHSFLNNKIGFLKKSKLPKWFDEGIAMQLDYRDYYCDSIIEKNYKTDMILLNRISSNTNFFNSDQNTLRYNYIIAKLEVQNLINKNGKNNFLRLIDSLKDGRDFSEIYK